MSSSCQRRAAPDGPDFTGGSVNRLEKKLERAKGFSVWNSSIAADVSCTMQRARHRRLQRAAKDRQMAGELSPTSVVAALRREGHVSAGARTSGRAFTQTKLHTSDTLPFALQALVSFIKRP